MFILVLRAFANQKFFLFEIKSKSLPIDVKSSQNYNSMYLRQITSILYDKSNICIVIRKSQSNHFFYYGFCESGDLCHSSASTEITTMLVRLTRL